MRRVFASLLSVILLLNYSPYAEAHSTLVSSNPKSGAHLSSLPARVTLTFNENLLIIAGKQPHTLVVTSANGNPIGVGSLFIKGSRISRQLSKKVAKGRFKVAYRVVSADGHPIQGNYFFIVK